MGSLYFLYPNAHHMNTAMYINRLSHPPAPAEGCLLPDPLICATIHVTAVWSPYRKGRKIWTLRRILILHTFIFQIHSKHLNTIVCASFASDITVLISSVLILPLVCYVYVYLPGSFQNPNEVMSLTWTNSSLAVIASLVLRFRGFNVCRAYLVPTVLVLVHWHPLLTHKPSIQPVSSFHSPT